MQDSRGRVHLRHVLWELGKIFQMCHGPSLPPMQIPADVPWPLVSPMANSSRCAMAPCCLQEFCMWAAANLAASKAPCFLPVLSCNICRTKPRVPAEMSPGGDSKPTLELWTRAAGGTMLPFCGHCWGENFLLGWQLGMRMPQCQSSCVSKLLVGIRGRDAIFFLAAVDAAWAPWWAVLEAAMLPWGSRRTFSLEQTTPVPPTPPGWNRDCFAFLGWCLPLSASSWSLLWLHLCACEWEVLQGRVTTLRSPCRNFGGFSQTLGAAIPALWGGAGTALSLPFLHKVPAHKKNTAKGEQTPRASTPSVSLKSLWGVTEWHPQSLLLSGTFWCSAFQSCHSPA